MTIKWLNANPILDLKEANLSTVRKRPKDDKMTPERFAGLLRSEHSTLRFLSLVIHDEECPYTVACQLVRSTKEHCQPEMSSGRPDWTGAPRDYTNTRWIHIKHTPVGLIRMMEDRMCTRAESATREWCARLSGVMATHDDVYIREIGKLCNTTCRKHGYCREGRDCFGVVK